MKYSKSELHPSITLASSLQFKSVLPFWNPTFEFYNDKKTKKLKKSSTKSQFLKVNF